MFFSSIFNETVTLLIGGVVTNATLSWKANPQKAKTSYSHMEFEVHNSVQVLPLLSFSMSCAKVVQRKQVNSAPTESIILLIVLHPCLRITQHTVGPLKRKPQIRSTKLPGVTLKGTP